MKKLLRLWVTVIFYAFCALHGDDSIYFVFPEECKGKPKRSSNGPYISSLAFCLGVSVKLSVRDANILVRYANTYDSSDFVRRIYFGKPYLSRNPGRDYLLNLKCDDILKEITDEGDVRANLMGILLACIKHDIVLPCWILQRFDFVNILAKAFGAEAENHWFLLSRLKLLELRMKELKISCRLEGNVYFHFCHPDFIFSKQFGKTNEAFVSDLHDVVQKVRGESSGFKPENEESSGIYSDLSKGKACRYRSIGCFRLGKKNRKSDNAKPKPVSKN